MKMKITPLIATAIVASLYACKSTTTIDPTPRDVTESNRCYENCYATH